MSEEDDAASEGEAGTDPSGIDIAGEVRDFARLPTGPLAMFTAQLVTQT